MSGTEHKRGTFVPPSPAELMSRYLQKRADDMATGLASTNAIGDVQPYEAGPVQPIDAKPAWEGVLAVYTFLEVPAEEQPKKVVPDWPTLVSGMQPVFDLSMAIGNFPQMVRNLQPLFQSKQLSNLRTQNVRPLALPQLMEWVNAATKKSKVGDMLLGAAILRVASEFEQAQQLLDSTESAVQNTQWQTVHANENAALAWHAGKLDLAEKLWSEQPESLPVLFNRGMARLFQDAPTDAKVFFTRVVDQIPETNAWHHLSRLYLTLC